MAWKVNQALYPALTLSFRDNPLIVPGGWFRDFEVCCSFLSKDGERYTFHVPFDKNSAKKITDMLFHPHARPRDFADTKPSVMGYEMHRVSDRIAKSLKREVAHYRKFFSKRGHPLSFNSY